MIFSFRASVDKALLNGLLFTLTLLSISCTESDDSPLKPEFSPIPFIELDNIEISLGENNRDTISITVNYQDGDSNLGLDRNAAKTDTIFQQLYYITIDQDTISTLNEKVIKLGAPDQPAFNKWDWYVAYDFEQQQYDTLRVVFNQNFFNGFVDIYVKRPGEEFELVDTGQVNNPFGAFNAVFLPIADQPLVGREYHFNFVPETLCNGKLTYRLVYAFNLAFEEGQDILKFKIFIKDRALNKSNVIETPEILFE